MVVVKTVDIPTQDGFLPDQVPFDRHIRLLFPTSDFPV